MKIREHHTVSNRCVWCGAAEPYGAQTCIEREVPASGMAPEPARRRYAVDDVEAISARLAELRRLALGQADNPVPVSDPADAAGFC